MRFLISVISFFLIGNVFSSGTLNLTNQIKGIEVNVVTDLICNYFLDSEAGPGDARYTTPLQENPIKYESPVTAKWHNCRIAETKFFSQKDYKDHSIIYFTFKDLMTGKIMPPVSMQVQSGDQTKTFEFDGKFIQVVLSHSGEYVYSLDTPIVYNTDTSVTFSAD